MSGQYGAATVCKIRDQDEVKAQKVRYYLEQRVPPLRKRWPGALRLAPDLEILEQAASLSKRKEMVE
jgi:hypothetical protein